mgnify:CR=1 FL=1
MLERALEQRLPAFECVVSPPEIDLPASLYFKNLHCRQKNTLRELLVEDIRITYTPRRSLTSFSAGLRFAKGRVKAHLRLLEKNTHLLFETIQLTAIDLTRARSLFADFDRSVSGSFFFNGKLRLRTSNFEIIEAGGDLILQDFNMELYKEIFWNRRLLLDELESELSLLDGDLFFNEGEMHGPLFSGKFNAVVKDIKNWQNAEIEGYAAINPEQSFLDTNVEARNQAQLLYRSLGTPYFPVRVSGTVHDPVIDISL